ncbi:XdhC family protein [Aliifodinibius sp. S!AR15-10]|uniref:XdhC family protein n=1 Tax=Aliifodinibius sp. S!AR15-10 TaxID=2950437 RepID=UPI00285DB496|nr:XdhC/CoxI family protein [Aliifodinibius sp. S!AR15-10]MDR8394043.1 XdhC family protein [Aliifodinibius sp. S!AR15-10]
MREIEAIISSYDEARNEGHKCVLATVVHVEGSSYRAAGARMLVDEYGFMTGAISGGCLEGDALRKALLALDQNRSKLITYDTSDEDDAVIGVQLGCNGIIQVLFEPIDPEKQNNPIELLRKAEHADQPVALVSLFNLDKTKHQAGIVLLVDEQSNITGQIDDQALCEKITSVARNSLKKRINHFGEYRSTKDTQHAFVEVISPPPRLVLVGAGNDAQVLSRMAEPLGWDIIVADGRPTHANKKRFNSCQVIVTNPGELLDNIEIHEQTAFVLMTHNYNYDLDVLKLLLNEEQVPYIGILGPNKKYQRMLDDLEEDGITLSEEQYSKIYAPVGLQLGAENPAEIGLSILSEIQGVLTDSDIRSLRELEGSIHNKENRKFREISL